MSKRFLLLLICSSFSFFLSAQTKLADLALKAGININSGKVNTGSRVYSGSGIGAHGGLTGNIQIAQNIVLQPGALLTLKRFGVKDLGGIKINHVGIDIPIVALYQLDNFFFGLGPSFNLALFGNYTYGDEKYKLYDKESDGRFSVKRFELAMNIMAGYKLKSGIFISADFAPGLSNLFNHSNFAVQNTTVKTSLIHFSIGLPLSSMKK